MISSREPFGDGALDNWARLLTRNIRSITLLPGQGYDLKRTTDGTFIVPKGGGGGGTSSPLIYACKCDGIVFQNYMSVFTINPNPSPVPTGAIKINNQWTFNVALPPLLRNNPAPTQGATIQPPYTLNQEVLVVQADGYNLAAPLLRDSNGKPILYVQIPDNRYWAIKTQFCSGTGTYINRWIASSDNVA